MNVVLFSTKTFSFVSECVYYVTNATGPVPIDSSEGERELEALKTRVKADYSKREFEDQENDQFQMDVSGVTEDDLNVSGQNENRENPCKQYLYKCKTNFSISVVFCSKILMNYTLYALMFIYELTFILELTSKSCLNDNFLGHGGESFLRSVILNNTSPESLWGELSPPEEEDEELEKTLSSHGSTLLDVYPSMLNQIGEAYRRQHVTDKARAVMQKYRRKHWQAGPTHCNTSFKNRHNCTLNKTTEISFTSQSPVPRNISNCFKSSDKLKNLLKNNPRSSPLKNSSCEASACFYSPRRNGADVSGVEDECPWTDLNLTSKPACVIDLSTPPHSGSPSFSDQSPDLDQTYDVGPTSHAVPASSVLSSPRQSTANLSLIDQRGISVFSQPSSLDKDCFRDRIYSSVPSPQRGLIGVLSPSGKSSFRPSVLNMERQLNTTASPKRRSPVHHPSHSEVLRSPYGVKQVPLSSPWRSVYDHPDQSLSKVENPSRFTPSNRQRSLSGPQSTYSFSEPQIDAEFRKLYHHFVCRGTSSPCPSSQCHLCERHMETSRSPSFSSSSMSALALTPLRAKLKKRHRQPEVEESLRFKRFRESRSPLKHLQLRDQCMSPGMSEPTEDKNTWDRAVLLQCPSPRFLRGTGNLRRIREAKLSMQMNPCALSRRDAPSGIHLVEAVSPMRLFNQGSSPLSPR
uniref:Si:dkeyp-117h8.4 n=1 Tax=Cyprinus carpio TaxID=7962 RepID=A0A8C1S6T9_CYPCA